MAEQLAVLQAAALVVIKRDGREQPCDRRRLETSIARALEAAGAVDEDLARHVADVVLATVGLETRTAPSRLLAELVDTILRGAGREAAAFAFRRAHDERARARLRLSDPLDECGWSKARVLDEIARRARLAPAEAAALAAEVERGLFASGLPGVSPELLSAWVARLLDARAPSSRLVLHDERAAGRVQSLTIEADPSGRPLRSALSWRALARRCARELVVVLRPRPAPRAEALLELLAEPRGPGPDLVLCSDDEAFLLDLLEALRPLLGEQGARLPVVRVPLSRRSEHVVARALSLETVSDRVQFCRGLPRPSVLLAAAEVDARDAADGGLALLDAAFAALDRGAPEPAGLPAGPRQLGLRATGLRAAPGRPDVVLLPRTDVVMVRDAASARRAGRGERCGAGAPAPRCSGGVDERRAFLLGWLDDSSEGSSRCD